MGRHYTATDREISLLKSATQKAVRRNEPESAASCMRRLAELDRTQAARRLSVIVIEDSLLHPDYPLLIQAPDVAVSLNAIVRIAWSSAACPVRDIWPEANRDLENAINSGFDDPKVLRVAVDSLPVEAQTLVLALIRRSRSGGMDWDVKLLYQYAQIWAWRFVWGGGVADEILSSVPLGGPEWIDVEPAIDVLPETVDNHCSSILWKLKSVPAIRKAVSREYPEENILDVIRTTIWCFRGGVNLKPTIQTSKPMEYLTVLPRYKARWGDDVKKKFARIYKVIAPVADAYSAEWRAKVLSTPATAQESLRFKPERGK